jgi:hypothetical protein
MHYQLRGSTQPSAVNVPNLITVHGCTKGCQRAHSDGEPERLGGRQDGQVLVARGGLTLGRRVLGYLAGLECGFMGTELFHLLG